MNGHFLYSEVHFTAKLGTTMDRFLKSPLSPAEFEIRRRIESEGPMTFAEFMSIALYWPNGGYYTTRETFGPKGDFFTAPLAHPVFGELIARQLEEMWRISGTPERWWVVEAGAGLGRLATDVTSSVVGNPLGVCLRYLGVDLSRPRSIIPGVSWAQSNALPVRGLQGVVLANELFDAMPVHRVIVVDSVLREVFIGLDANGSFIDVLGDVSLGIAERLDGLGVVLNEGQRAEVCLELYEWMANVSSAMDAGYLLLIDYGHEARAYYDASRHHGLLRTYYKHTLGVNPYIHVGRQDISVHVELTSLRSAAIACGFIEVGSTKQADFLRSLGFDAYRTDIASRVDLGQVVRDANLAAMDTLMDSEGMGGFNVLVFAKGVPARGLSGFSDVIPDLIVNAPIATDWHMPLGGEMREPFDIPRWEDLLK